MKCDLAVHIIRRFGALRLRVNGFGILPFRHELVFEIMALACGKVNQTQAACHMVRKNS